MFFAFVFFKDTVNLSSESSVNVFISLAQFVQDSASEARSVSFLCFFLDILDILTCHYARDK